MKVMVKADATGERAGDDAVSLPLLRKLYKVRPWAEAKLMFARARALARVPAGSAGALRCIDAFARSRPRP